MSNQKTWLDVVIPTRNRATVLQQNLPNLIRQAEETGASISFYDNASTDGTREYLLSLSQKYDFIRYFRNEENIGLDRNMLLGIEQTCGEYSFWLGDDDELRPDALVEIRASLHKYSPEVLILSMTHAPAEWPDITEADLLVTDAAAFFSEYWNQMPFGTIVVRSDLAKTNLEASQRFVDTYHAYSGLVWDLLANHQRQNGRISAVFKKDSLVKSLEIKKTWSEDHVAVFLTGIHDWFDRLEPQYEKIKESKRYEFMHWPSYLDILFDQTNRFGSVELITRRLRELLLIESKKMIEIQGEANYYKHQIELLENENLLLKTKIR